MSSQEIEAVHHWARKSHEADTTFEQAMYSNLAENEQAYRRMGEL